MKRPPQVAYTSFLLFIQQEINNAIEMITINTPLFISSLTDTYFWQFKQQPYTKRELDFIRNAPPITIGCVSGTDPVS